METNTTTKRTDELVPGDRVHLPNGAVRTVASIDDAGYRGAVGNHPVRVVRYAEPGDTNWRSQGNTAIDSTIWNVTSTAQDAPSVAETLAHALVDTYRYGAGDMANSDLLADIEANVPTEDWDGLAQMADVAVPTPATIEAAYAIVRANLARS